MTFLQSQSRSITSRQRARFLGSLVILLGCLSFLPNLAFSQDVVEGAGGDEAPIVVPQRESVTIEPYTGPPIFLPDPPPLVPSKEIETRTVTEYFDPEEKKHPRIERGIVRYSDESIKCHGAYREFYQDGQVFVEGRYDRGEPTGDWKYFHENGSEAKTVTYEDGLPNGMVECRRADGTLRAKREFSAGKRIGDWILYGDSGENLLREEHYVDGKADGLWKHWYPDGTNRRQSPFVGGKLDGTVIEWGEDGEKRAEAVFVDGKRHGISVLWTADGRKVEQEYKEGKLVVTKVAEE